MLEKGAITQVCHKEGEFLSHIFLVISSGKNRWGEPTANQSQKLKQICVLSTFQIGCFALSEIFIAKDDYMGKIDLKDPYLSLQLQKDSQKLLLSQWQGSLWMFLCICF